jgi:predicted short-subunit dehydrogenase-like oxidoreductase (DUF2520 family)
MLSVAIVGTGRLGGALALALSRSGFDVRQLVHRSADNALAISRFLPGSQLISVSDDFSIDSDVVIITTPDPDITAAARWLAGRLLPQAIVMHTSGSLGSDVLSDLPNATASLHPLVSISDSFLGADKFADAYFCIEGDGKAVDVATEIVNALGGKPFSIETHLKPLYHASAVIASGHFVTLEDTAVEVLSRCGLTKDESKRILMPLVRSTLENLEAQPTERALTGTFARADIKALERHLASFENRVPEEVREIYVLLAERSLDLAERAGIDRSRTGPLRQVLAVAKSVVKAKPEC